MKKRYCIFSAQYLPHMGGVERYTYNLAKKLVEKGNDVTVVTSNVENVLYYEHMDGIQVYRMPCFNFMNGRFPVLKLNRQFWKMHRIISKKSYDLIVVNTRFYIHSIYGAIFAKKRARCIFIEHGTSHLTLHNRFLDFAENIVEHLMTKVEIHFCKEFYGVSNACVDWLIHFNIQGKGTLYNAVELSDFEDNSEESLRQFREKYKIPKDAIVITFTGRLLKEKGILTLIKAVEELNKVNKNIYLLIAGDGDEESTVRQMKTKNIIPLGRISADRIIALLKESDIFCLPSDSEGMSTSVLEAAACKCYIITTKQGGAVELIIDDNYGMIIDNNDIQTVIRAIEKAIAQKDKRRRAVELTYDRLKELFTWDKVADKIMKI